MSKLNKTLQSLTIPRLLLFSIAAMTFGFLLCQFDLQKSLSPKVHSSPEVVHRTRYRLTPLGDPVQILTATGNRNNFNCARYLTTGEQLHNKLGQTKGSKAQKEFVERMSRYYRRSNSILNAYDQYDTVAKTALRKANPQFAKEYDDLHKLYQCQKILLSKISTAEDRMVDSRRLSF